MKIIYITPILLISLFLGISQAQQNSKIAAHHVGNTTDHYPLGTRANPVIANEYCAFLNSNADALGDRADAISTAKSVATVFYDPTFMNVSFITNWNNHSETRNTDCITRHNEYHFYYSVIPDRGDYIIDGLSWTHCFDWMIIGSDEEGGFSPFAIVSFDDWRKNPTSQEICDYLNKKIMGNNDAAALIKKSYSTATVVFNFLDTLAIKAQEASEVVLQDQSKTEGDNADAIFLCLSCLLFPCACDFSKKA